MSPFNSLRAAALACLFGAASVGVLAPSVASAGAPMVKSQAPGFYRIMLGDFEVTALCDGTAPLGVDKLLAAGYSLG